MQFIPQFDQMDCGPACLCMVASAYGKKYSLQYLRDNSFITREGVSLLGIKEASVKIGFDSFSIKLSISKLIEIKQDLPCVIHWNKNHFVILRKITKSFIGSKYHFHISDPAHGLITLDEKKFKKHWISDNDKGVALLLYPTKKFYELEPHTKEKIGLKFLFKYLKSYQKQLFLMFLMLLLGSGITLIFPFLTQSLIDNGVNAKNLNLITLLLLAQLGLFFGSIAIEVIRNWLMLYMGTKISITIISDFLKKLLQLPVKFFDTKMMGDFNQRIQDNERIEHFLTSQSLLTFFSMITFSVFFGVLWFYDYKILLVYLILTFFLFYGLFIGLEKNIYWIILNFRKKVKTKNLFMR